MDDDEIRDSIKRLRREVTDVSDAIVSFGKKKANTDDVEAVNRKLSGLEDETRVKYATIHSDNQEIRHSLRQLIEAVDALRVELSHHKRDTAEELKVKSKQDDQSRNFGTPLRLQIFLYVLAGVGLLAVMQGAPQALLGVFPALAR